METASDKPGEGEKHWKFIALAIGVVYCFVYFDLISGRRTFTHDAMVWYGTFYYYLEQMKLGIFPYWDPYSQMGTYFYPNISGYGLLDPFCLASAAAHRIFDIAPLTLFIFFRLYRIIVFIAGAFLLFRYVSRNSLVAAVSAGILLFTVTAQNLGMPMMDYSFTIPIALYFILLLLDHIDDKRRYLYLFCLALITGITMNVFIPALYLFNIVFFVILLFAFRLYSLKRVFRAFRDRRMAAAAVACLTLVVMMSAPPFSVLLFDTSDNGELFAVAKLVDSNNMRFKMMMASQCGGDIFFDKMRKGSGTFISTGSVLSLLFPDMKGLNYRTGTDNSPVISLYVGIIPLILLSAGSLYARSRLTWPVLTMLLLVFLAAFSLDGVYSVYNPLQEFMNTVFPPLRMLDTRINFSSVISFYMCMLFCLSASSLMRSEVIMAFSGGQFRGLILVCLAPMALKLISSGYYQTGSFFISAYDAAVFFLPLFAVSAFLAVRAGISRSHIALVMLLFLSVSDVAAANFGRTGQLAPDEAYSMVKDRGSVSEVEDSDLTRSYLGFELFRIPYVPPKLISPLQSFTDLILQKKTAFMGHVLSSIFTTRRYYDFFSMLKPEEQMLIDGVLYPIVRFYRADDVRTVTDGLEVFNHAFQGDFNSFENRLFVEMERPLPDSNAGDCNIAGFKDLWWFRTNRINTVYNVLLPQIAAVRQNSGRFLNTADHTVHVTDFTVNELVLSVENGIDGYLYYNDGWSKYWRAYDGNRELPVLAANYNSKAVFLSSGKHTVRFVFDPRHYKVALFLYYSGLASTLACMIFLLVRLRRATTPE